MPRLVIDDLEIEVPAGTKVIDAAERLGIMIPRFCYHEALGAVGACRMCAVKFIHGPFKGIQMSCMIDARDGMVVSTTDPEAVAFRKRVIEWLMLNHPHDCPVCDEGGQCLLQDETISSGHGLRNYRGKKRTYRDQYLGPFIQHEMNRCIHCYRCSRYYQEFSGYRDLGPLSIGDRIYFGRFRDGALESPFAGNLVDVCPTGVYTDKTARFKVRRWDLQRTTSVCINCSLGCNTIGNAHFRALMRVEGRMNEFVNGYFICDEGRFGFSYANGGKDHTRRVWTSMMGGIEVTVDRAVKESARKLAEIAGQSGSRSIAAVGSSRNSLETQCMLNRVCRTNKWRGPSYFTNPAVYRKVRSAIGKLDQEISWSMREIESADLVIVAGADPLNEAPMAAMAIRQAFRKGAPVVAMDPRPISMPLEFEHFPVAPGQIEQYLGYMIRASFSEEDQQKLQGAPEKFFQTLATNSGDKRTQANLQAIAEMLGESKKPVIVCGTDVVRESTPAFAANCSLLLRQAGKSAGIFYVFPGASSYSSALLSDDDGENSFPSILEGIERGDIKALVAVESDPFRDFPDEERLRQALSKLSLLISIDYLPTRTVQQSSIVHPSSTMFEMGSTFINQEGRVQFAERVHRGGIPIWGNHPPRVYTDSVPGGDHRPAWEILWRIAGESGGYASDSVPMSPGDWIPGEHPALGRIDGNNYPTDGLKIVSESSGPDDGPISPEAPSSRNPAGLELLLVDRLFDSRELSVFSDTLDSARPEPLLCMHPNDAKEARLSDGDRITLEMDRGNIELKLSVSDSVAEGVLILPRQEGIEWRKLRDFSTWVSPGQIRKS